jgi:hypothetical protein
MSEILGIKKVMVEADQTTRMTNRSLLRTNMGELRYAPRTGARGK